MGDGNKHEKEDEVTTDVWIDLVLIAMLSLIIVQNMGLRERLRKIEARFDR